MRIAFDVSPLSHPRTGVGNYILGSLRGLLEAAGDEHDVVAFAPTSPWGRPHLLGALDGVPVERKVVTLPLAHAWRTAWSRAGYPPAELFLGPFDVLHFWDWMYPPQRSGVRATMIHDLVPLRFPEWTTRRTRAMHRAKYRNAARTCDVIFVNSRYTGDDVGERLGVVPE
ncbi:MAG TPA: glycosyltransferase, partial [Gaiellaceae bacterium]|nr:glycosyltransferase [Gaiellaceae bacterium]